MKSESLIIPPAPFFFLRIALDIGGLCFHTNLIFFYSISLKNAIENLIGIALNLYLAFGNIIILTIWILPIQEYGISFHLFVSLQFLSSMSYSFHNIGLFFPLLVGLFLDIL